MMAYIWSWVGDSLHRMRGFTFKEQRLAWSLSASGSWAYFGWRVTKSIYNILYSHSMQWYYNIFFLLLPKSFLPTSFPFDPHNFRNIPPIPNTIAVVNRLAKTYAHHSLETCEPGSNVSSHLNISILNID